MQHSLRSCVIYWGISCNFFSILGICTCTILFLALLCYYSLFVFKEWQNFESWLFCLHVCPSMPNIFLKDNVSLIQLVPHYCKLIAGAVNLSETLYEAWSWSTNTFFLTEFTIQLPVIPPNNWWLVCGALTEFSQVSYLFLVCQLFWQRNMDT